jgi:hypothetical protein
MGSPLGYGFGRTRHRVCPLHQFHERKLVSKELKGFMNKRLFAAIAALALLLTMGLFSGCSGTNTMLM